MLIVDPEQRPDIDKVSRACAFLVRRTGADPGAGKVIELTDGVLATLR
jgi:hypothetical protein